MPISKYNPDGTVDIYNSKTGEVRSGVKAEELGTISPRLVAEYHKGQDPEALLSRKTAEASLAELEKGGGVKDEFAGKKKTAFAAVQQLEKLFGRGEAGNVGTNKDLSITPSSTVFGKLAGKGANLVKKISDPNFQQDANIFKSALEATAGVFTQAFGSGTPQEAEAKRFMESAPGPGSTDKEARAWFDNVKVFLGQSPEQQVAGSAIDQKKNEGEITTSQPIGPQEQDQSLFERTALKVADIAPTVMGTTGGVLGAVLSNVPGALVGAAGGGAVGEMIKTNIRSAFDAEDRNSVEMIKAVGSGALREAAFEGLGLGVGKFLLKPLAKGAGWILKSAVKGIDDLPLRGIRFAPTDITTFAKKHGGQDLADFMINRGYLGEDALDIASQDATRFQKEFDNLALNKNIKIPVRELNERFTSEIADLAGNGERIVPSIAKNIAKSVTNEWASIINQLKNQGRDFVTPEELTLFRRTIDEIIPPSQFVDPSIKNINIRVRRIMNDVVSEGIESRMIGQGEKGSLKIIGNELSSIYDLLEFAEKRAGKGRGSLVANLPRTLMGGAGALLGATFGNVPGAIIGGTAGVVGEQLLRDPEILKVLLKIGRGATKAGAKIAPATSRFVESLPYTTGAGSILTGEAVRQASQ